MPGLRRTRPASTTQSSCIITVSAPSGIGAPVKMRIASPRRGRAAERMAGRRPAGNRQDRLAIGQQIGMDEREAVDGAVGVRRHIDLGDEIAREDAPGRLDSGTTSSPTTGAIRAAISASAASTPSSAPPKAKQSSLSCAMGRARDGPR